MIGSRPVDKERSADPKRAGWWGEALGDCVLVTEPGITLAGVALGTEQAT